MSQESKGKGDRKAGCLHGTLKKTDYGRKKKSAITMDNQIGLHPRTALTRLLSEFLACHLRCHS